MHSFSLMMCSSAEHQTTQFPFKYTLWLAKMEIQLHSNLEAELPPKAYVLRGWFPEWLYREVMETLRGRAYWEVLRSLGACALKGLLSPTGTLFWLPGY